MKGIYSLSWIMALLCLAWPRGAGVGMEKPGSVFVSTPPKTTISVYNPSEGVNAFYSPASGRDDTAPAASSPLLFL